MEISLIVSGASGKPPLWTDTFKWLPLGNTNKRL
jgi:hypothetical protein